MSYIEHPRTIEDYLSNVEFQLSNIQGYLSIKDTESAEIKARALIDASRELEQHLFFHNYNQKIRR